MAHVITSLTLPTTQLLGRIGPVGLPPNRGNITLLWLFVYFFLGHAPRFNRGTDSYAKWLKDVFPPKDGPFGGHDDG